MKIAMIGTGYVGLVTGVCLSHLGHTVACIDADVAKIDNIKRGVIPIYETGLNRLLHQCVQQGRLSFTNDLQQGIKGCAAVFICVGTPSRSDGSADVSAVFAVAERIACIADDTIVVVDKSTVPVGKLTQVTPRDHGRCPVKLST